MHVIGVGAGKILGCEGFLPKFPQTFPKNSNESDLLKQDCISFHVGRIFWDKSTLQAPFLLKVPPNLRKFPLTCLKKNKCKDDLKKVCTLILGAISVRSKHIQRFCEHFHTFCQNFHRFCPDFKLFCPDFHQTKRFGGADAPHAPPLPTPVMHVLAWDWLFDW